MVSFNFLAKIGGTNTTIIPNKNIRTANFRFIEKKVEPRIIILKNCDITLITFEKKRCSIIVISFVKAEIYSPLVAI